MNHRQKPRQKRIFRNKSSWPVLLGLAWLVCFQVGISAGQDSPDPGLRLGEPYTRDDRVFLDCKLSGLIAGDVLEALHSGLPATLIFEWQLWADRDGMWDRREATGMTFYRIYYDVLQNRYDVFDRRGRLHATAEDSAGTENCFRGESALEIPSVPSLLADRLYYFEIAVRIEPLDEEEIRNLEDWLRGDAGDRSSLGLVSTLSSQAVKWLKGFVIPESSSSTARTGSFAGWD